MNDVSARLAAAAGSIIGLLSVPLPAFALDPVGTWYTAGQRAQVRIADCDGEALCGEIVWLKEPNDPQTGKPKTDSNNPDAARRNQRLVGLRIFAGLKSAGPDRWTGQIYNPDEGKTYDGYLTMRTARTLELKGCVLAGIICKSETWTRAR